jgi:hypothetical protein
MLTQEQIIYVDLLKREYSHLDKAALLKLFFDAQWSEAESSEAIARFDGVYVTTPPPPSATVSQQTVNSPAWLPPPKASRYADIIFEDIVVAESSKETASKFSLKTPSQKVVMIVGTILVFATAAFVFYVVTHQH